jgi:serine/threonine-protein kinase
VLSAGLPLVRVPSLVGMPLDEVIATLEARSFEVSRVDETYSERPEGTVISQRPTQGTLEWGSAVALVASKGRQPVAVPALERRTLKAARTRLERAGLRVRTERAYSDTVPHGDVIGTMPAAGQVVPEGSRIELTVSKGPRFAELVMPDVRNTSVDNARARLDRLGLRVEVIPSCEGSTVVETDPIQGTPVRENDLVALFVC